MTLPIHSSTKSHHLHNTSWFGLKGRGPIMKIHAVSNNGAVSRSCSSEASSSSAGDVHRRRSSFESLFCYDKAVPEEIIEKPVGLSLAEKSMPRLRWNW
ncbi:hypothetical protein F0562_017274 [Nyssa sinensis]|uniref:Uncharacterized protein n=1 Tax=Nyssa sinensis TaxID=561372 RepID=A0A5J4ZHA2_9ASTE|nr:hypothetical protein F0562_017274 [Nyssa sinensis]